MTRPDTLDENQAIRAVLHREQWAYVTGTHGEGGPDSWVSAMKFVRGRETLTVRLTLTRVARE